MLGDDVDVYAVEEEGFGFGEESVWVVPGFEGNGGGGGCEMLVAC